MYLDCLYLARMIMKTLALLLFFLGGLLAMDGFREVQGFDSSLASGEEAEDQCGEIDPAEIEFDEPHSLRNVYLEWDDSPSFGGMDNGLRVAGDSSQLLFFAQSSLEKTDLDYPYTLLDKRETSSLDTSRKKGSESQRDWWGISRDTAFYLGYQAFFAGVLYFMPESVSGWSEDYKKTTISHWKNNVQNPVWDKDQWWINYIFHPYWGAIYYIRARERGFGEFGSFCYSTLLSALFEFGIEAFFEPPSINDLIVTPVGGYLVGKFIFEPIRTHIEAKPQRKWYDSAGLIATDPLGALNGVFEKLFGIKSDIRVQFPDFGGPRTEGPFDDRSIQWKEVNLSRHQGLSLQLHFSW